ncbi:MAG TPA: DUF998 domain-containing protein [Rubrivivax sp.]|jgi:hypothetical protein|nr:DUF998 domain-containing protein [Rubrivivax sp.]
MRRTFDIGFFTAGLLLLFASFVATAAPSKVTAGAYVNRVLDVNFKESRYSADIYIWFRWKAEGELADYKPLETMELMNGKVESVTGVVEKKIGDVNYAQARVSATVFHNFELANFPFDSHRIHVDIEDSAHPADRLVFVPDTTNSRLGDEIGLAGWKLLDYAVNSEQKTYRTNYGDISLPTDARSDYSRLTIAMSMKRDGHGAAIKLLSTVLAATLVAFVAFGIKPTEVDPRFGLGVGALFAVAASAFVVSSAVPDSSLLTAADRMHMLSMAFIFASLVQSAFCLKWDLEEKDAQSKRLDRICLVAFPAAFLLAALWTVRGALP